jgi:cytochrome c-type biogenesis protein CcsB
VPVNIGLAQLSEDFLLTTVIFYALAMLAYAAEFAYGKRGAVTAATESAVTARVPVTVGAAVGGNRGMAGGAPGNDPAAASAADTSGEGAAAPHRLTGWVKGALGLTLGGLATHLAAVATRGIAEHRVPWGNMYEFITAITCAAVIAFLAVLARYRVFSLGLFVMTPVVACLGLAATVLYTPAGAVVPALQSYWIAIHVTAMVLAIGGFMVAAVMTVLYLVADRVLAREERPGAAEPAINAILRRLPSRDALDRLSYRVVMFAFPVWTFGIIAGAIWADEAWGRYWGWDPKETWSFITWVVYACYLHARATSGWRGRKAAYFQLAGFGCLLFNVVGVNLWITGLHSYAGLG